MSVIALAGRRIDAEGAPTRFPAARIPAVRERIRAMLLARGAEVIVCSAACGADLLALEAATDLGLRRRIVFPFAPARFRETSVIDRGKEWGPVFDRMIGTVDAGDDLVVLGGDGEEAIAYAKVNLALLDHAQALAAQSKAPQSVLAAIVWEGAARGPDDLTAHFKAQARARGLEVLEIPTV